MSNTKLYTLDSETLPKELAAYTIAIQNKTLQHKERFDVAISGGSLANTMAKGMLQNPGIHWEKWNIWLADERIVPLEHADSNFGLFKKEVLDHLPENKQPRVYPLDVSRPLDTTPSEALAAEYQERLISVLGPKPSIDLLYMGMGPDGHTCSLFPGHKLMHENQLFVSSLDDSPKPPPRRITLTLPTIALAEEILYVATGSGKQDAMAGIFNNSDEKLPSYHVNQIARNPVAWFVDSAAVAKVNSSAL